MWKFDLFRGWLRLSLIWTDTWGKLICIQGILLTPDKQPSPSGQRVHYLVKGHKAVGALDAAGLEPVPFCSHNHYDSVVTNFLQRWHQPAFPSESTHTKKSSSSQNCLNVFITCCFRRWINLHFWQISTRAWGHRIISPAWNKRKISLHNCTMCCMERSLSSCSSCPEVDLKHECYSKTLGQGKHEKHKKAKSASGKATKQIQIKMWAGYWYFSALHAAGVAHI